MTERIKCPPVHLGIFFMLLIAVAAVMSALAPPLKAFLFTLFWGGVYGGGLYACRRFGEANDAQFVQLANAGALLALLLAFAGVTFAGVEVGLLLLLLTLQAGRNLALFTRRDLNFACLLSLILLLYGAGRVMEGYFVVFIILYPLAAIFTFMADHIDARLSHAHGGDRELLARRMNLPVKGIGLAALTLALAFAIYLVTPQPPSPRLQVLPSTSNWDYDNRHGEKEGKRPGEESEGENRRGDATSATGQNAPAEESRGNRLSYAEYNGFQSQFDITTSGVTAQIREADAIVLFMQADRPLYSRGKVFDTFDGRRWEECSAGIEKRYSRGGQFTLGSRQQPGDTLQVYYVRQDLPPSIFAAYRPLLAAFPANTIETGPALTLRAPDRLHNGTVYSIVSRLDEIDGHPCAKASEPDEDGRATAGRYLTLYPDISARVRSLARDVTREARDDFSRARALETYLRNNFTYSRDTVGITWSGNPVEQFLFDLRAGHCELFASSMVVLLRTLDIPARLVTGFHVNRYNPVTGYFEVRRSDGHAWVEAYLEPHGWVTFEPTSAFTLPQSQPRLFVASGLVSYIADRSEELIRKNRDAFWAKLLLKLWPLLLKIWLALKLVYVVCKLYCLKLCSWFLRVGWLLLVLLAGSAGGGWALWRFFEPAYRLAKLRQAMKGDPRQFMHRCYREMERLCAARGVVRPPQMTPLEYEQLLANRFPALQTRIAIITRLFQQAAYGSQPLLARDAAEALQAFVEMQRYRDPAGAKV